MATHITTTKLLKIGVVVYDLEEKVSEYTRLYGITEWDIQECVPETSTSHGRVLKNTPGSWRSAVGTTPVPSSKTGPAGGPARRLTFELIQPTGGESPFNEFLRTKREGICFLSVASSAPSVSAVADHFDSVGVKVAYSAQFADGTRTFYDTRSALGGFLIEMLPQADGHVDSAEDLSPTENGSQTPLLPVQGIYHFGVLVDDVMAALPKYRDILGIQSFDMKTWESGFGRLDDPYYRAQREPTGYFTAQGFAGDFGFEIIQVNYGNNHYNREFFDDRGPGIHHFFSWMTTAENEWGSLIKSMNNAGHELCMGSMLRGGAAEFGYFDTFEALGGYLVEIVIRRQPPKPEYAAPDWVVDFGELP